MSFRQIVFDLFGWEEEPQVYVHGNMHNGGNLIFVSAYSPEEAKDKIHRKLGRSFANAEMELLSKKLAANVLVCEGQKEPGLRGSNILYHKLANEDQLTARTETCRLIRLHKEAFP